MSQDDDLARLREIQENRQESIRLDNKQKKSHNLSISATSYEWSKVKNAKKLLKLNKLTISEYISCILLKLDQNMIDEFIRLGILENKFMNDDEEVKDD